MSDKLKAADTMARAAMCVIDTQNLGSELEQQKALVLLYEALAAYEAAPAEGQAAGDWIPHAAKAIARWAYGYYNGNDCGPSDAIKYWDGVGHQLPGPKWTVEFVSQLLTELAPSDQSQQLAAAQDLVDKLLKSVSDGDALLLQASANIQEHIGHGDELERKLAAAQARIAELTAYRDVCNSTIKSDEVYQQLLEGRVAVLEKALEGAREAVKRNIVSVFGQPLDVMALDAINAALAAQPSREKEGK